MLIGYYKVGDRKYDLRGYDFGDSISLYLSCAVSKLRKTVDNGISIGDKDSDDYEYSPASWDDLYISIGTGNVKVDKYIEIVDGVKYSNAINKGLICRIAEIIQGMKASCTRSNRADLIDTMYNEFNPKKVVNYNIPNKGTCNLRITVLLDIHYCVGDEELLLEDDGSSSERVVPLANYSYKYKLDLSEFVTKTEIDDGWDLGDDRLFTVSEIIERNPDKNYAWIQDRKYTIVSDIKEVEEICNKIWNHKGIVSFDTETTGLKVNVMSRVGAGDRLVGMVFSIKPGEAWYFPVAHKKVKNICTPDNEGYIIEKYFKPILEKKELLCQNGSFDWKVMYNYKISINLKHDLYILLKVTLWNDNRGMSLGLKSVVKEYLGRDSFELSDFVVGKFDSSSIKFWDFDYDSVKSYACPDTDSLLEVYNLFMNSGILNKYGAKKIYEIEVAFSIVIAYQEYYGHCVDITKIDDLVAAIREKKDRTYKKMVEIAGRDFNPNSSIDLNEILFKTLKYPIMGYTDTGNPSCDKKAREAWMGFRDIDGNPLYPMAEYLDEWKNASTLESNFTKNIDKFATEEGLMFSSVEQFLETGRVSTKDPNYQSYSNEVKKYIVPRSGYYAMDADYSSVEARIMVSMAGCTNMINKLKDPDADYHTLKASDMFNVPYELVTKQLRQMSKGVNFGILYGLGDPNLGKNLYGKKCPENTRKAAKQKQLYFRGMEELKSFIDVSKDMGITKHYSTTYFNRRRYFDPRKVRKDTIERRSCNARIQGTAADIYKVAMVRLFTNIRKLGLMGKVLISAFVHDECFLEVHKCIDPCKLLKLLRGCMMLEIKGWCPLFIGCGFGRNWYEAKKTEIPVQVQEIMIDNYGTTGLDWWDGNTDQLYTWEVNMINNYRRDRVLSYLKNEENWHKVFSPIENGLCHEVMDEIKKGVPVEGVVDLDFECSKDMIENLKGFCKAFGCMDLFEKADIQKPTEVHNNTNNDSDEEEYVDFDISSEEIVNMRIENLGVYCSDALYFRYDESDSVLMRLVKSNLEKNPGDLEVVAIKNGEQYSTGMSTSTKVYPKLLQLYMSRKNIVRSAAN